MGDVDIDAHHTVEDTAIVLGQALGQALGDKAGIRRFGDASIPMDETLAHAAVDVSGRPFCVHTGEPEMHAGFTVGNNYPVVLNRHVFDSLAFHAQIALHVRVIYGRDPHHICEAQYKAIARALREAVEPDPRVPGHPVHQGRAVGVARGRGPTVVRAGGFSGRWCLQHVEADTWYGCSARWRRLAGGRRRHRLAAVLTGERFQFTVAVGAAVAARSPGELLALDVHVGQDPVQPPAAATRRAVPSRAMTAGTMVIRTTKASKSDGDAEAEADRLDHRLGGGRSRRTR